MGKNLGSGNVITAQIAYHLDDGDRMDAPVVSSAGVLGVHAGGTATNIVESGGLVVVDDGATVTFKPTVFTNLVLSSANLGGNEVAIHTATVHSGTTANKTTLSAGYYLNVYNGGWNDSPYKRDAKGKEDKTELDATLNARALVLERGLMSGANPGAIKLDDGADGTDDWGGFSDAADYRMLKLEHDVRLTLNLKVAATETGKGKAKLTIWKVSTGKGGKITLSSKGSIEVKQGATGTIKTKYLTEGTYFISVTSSSASKGGDVSYSVKVDEKTVFFDQRDTTDDWKDLKDYGATGHVGTFGSAKVKSTDTLDGWVGKGDEIDYKGFTVDAGTQLCFGLEATDATKFTVYELVSKTKGTKTTYSLKTLQSVTLKETEKGSGNYQGATAFYTFEEAGTYYFSMQSTNAKKYGNASYHVTVGMMGGSSEAALTAPEEDSLASALAMPETDTLGISDALGFGGYDADVLADASASTLAEMDDKTGWLNIASLA